MLPFLIFAALTVGAQPTGKERIEITLERTTCFGTCPSYRVALSADGAVEYEGRQYVRVTGKQTWKIDPEAVAALAREMEAAGYFELQDRYTEHITDLPTTFTSLRIGARFKRIEDYFGAPEALQRLEKRIEEVAGVKKFVTIDGATLRAYVAGGLSIDSSEVRGWFADAVSAGDADVVGAALDLGLDVNAAKGLPPILHARGADVYRLLLDAGQSARARDAQDATPLHRAASMGDSDAVSLLLSAGADVNARNKSGTTPLMEAASSGSAETVRRLLGHGADRNARDSRGHTALQYAQDRLSIPNLFGPNEFTLIVNLLNGGR